MNTYRGVMHAHSTYSYDGHLTLAELKSVFQRDGFHFILMTEHTDKLTSVRADEFIRECHQLSDDHFIIIPGFEVPYRDAHIMCVDVDDLYDSQDSFSLIDRFFRAGALIILAHPHRNYFVLDDRIMNLIHGVEIWNSQYDGKRSPRFSSLSYFNVVHTRRSDVLAYAGLDFHRLSHYGGPFLRIESEALNRKMIMSCLREGRYVLEASGVRVSSRGVVSGSHVMWLRLVSLWSMYCIYLGKRVNSLLKRIGLSLPRSLTYYIRRFL